MMSTRFREWAQHRITRLVPAGAALVLLGFAAAASAQEQDLAPSAFPDGLSGRDLYRRVLDNHLSTTKMEQRTISEDPGGDRQESRVWARFKDYRVEGQPNEDGVVSKSVMKYTFPQSRRDSGYLFIEKHRSENEGYNYARARGKVMRMRTSEETVFGTDFTLEDLVSVRILDDATYERRSDEDYDGIRVHVVVVNYLPEFYPQYQKSQLWIDPETWVPLKTINWAHDGTERNVMEAKRCEIQPHADAWVPMEVVMRDLRDETTSWLFPDTLEANPEIPDVAFEPPRIGRNRRR